MALLLSPRFLSLSPNHSLSLHRTPPFNSSLSSSAIRISSSAAENTKTGGTAVLWFKHDLRIDDHPGLLAASRHRTLIPLYVFDPRILSRQFSNILSYIYASIFVMLARPFLIIDWWNAPCQINWAKLTGFRISLK